jgi:hypothetical protein
MNFQGMVINAIDQRINQLKSTAKRPVLGAPFFVIAMVLTCVAICLIAVAATIEGDNPK